MTKTYERTEDGTTTRVTVTEGLAEVNTAMMEGRHTVRTMSSGHGRHDITYTDGRHVVLILVDTPAQAEKDSAGRPIVTVKGKRYVVSGITPARPRTPGAKSWTPEAYVTYWSERGGETFGPTRFASGSRKPGTVGRAIWDAVNQ